MKLTPKSNTKWWFDILYKPLKVQFAHITMLWCMFHWSLYCTIASLPKSSLSIKYEKSLSNLQSDTYPNHNSNKSPPKPNRLWPQSSEERRTLDIRSTENTCVLWGKRNSRWNLFSAWLESRNLGGPLSFLLGGNWGWDLETQGTYFMKYGISMLRQ